MDETKRPWQSKALWGAVAALIASAWKGFAPDTAPDEDKLLEVILTVVQLVGLILAFFGRSVADRRITWRG